ncbi:MAG: ligase-associated DNA damage response exonuclease [Caulobacterales bacterium]|nr:ligase-associated DNA damage response exonuclease [Caulobacterales bacterium]
MRPDELLRPTPAGLYCPPGDFYIDPVRPVERAVITHGHADHARAGHQAVLATPETIAIMAARYGEAFCARRQPAAYGEDTQINGVSVSLIPAGHVLGSAQAVVEKDGLVIAVSGDFKRRRDPTCALFEPPRAHIYVTEATFGLPVFRHPDDAGEIAKLLASLALFPERAHLVGAYSLGKAQRVIALLREAGWEAPIYIHGAMKALCALYEEHGLPLGPLEPATLEKGGRGERAKFAGQIIIGPPSALTDLWARRFPDPLIAFASGWMRVRQRAKQRGVELPLILSDHADWDELTSTVRDIAPEELWVTHGREDALVRWAELEGVAAKPLSLVGYEDENE